MFHDSDVTLAEDERKINAKQNLVTSSDVSQMVGGTNKGNPAV